MFTVKEVALFASKTRDLNLQDELNRFRLKAEEGCGAFDLHLVSPPQPRSDSFSAVYVLGAQGVDENEEIYS